MGDFEGVAREFWGTSGSLSADTGVASHRDVYLENGVAYCIAARILAIHLLRFRDLHGSTSEEEVSIVCGQQTS